MHTDGGIGAENVEVFWSRYGSLEISPQHPVWEHVMSCVGCGTWRVMVSHACNNRGLSTTHDVVCLYAHAHGMLLCQHTVEPRSRNFIEHNFYPRLYADQNKLYWPGEWNDNDAWTHAMLDVMGARSPRAEHARAMMFSYHRWFIPCPVETGFDPESNASIQLDATRLGTVTSRYQSASGVWLYDLSFDDGTVAKEVMGNRLRVNPTMAQEQDEVVIKANCLAKLVSTAIIALVLCMYGCELSFSLGVCDTC